MESKHQENVSAKTNATTDIGNGHFEKVSAVFQNDEDRQQSPENARVGISANEHQNIQTFHATSEEVHELKEQIQSLQMQVALGLSTLNPKRPPQDSVEESETLQRIEKCLRDHSDEWKTKDGPLTLDAITTAVEYLSKSQYHKSKAIQSRYGPRSLLTSHRWLSRIDSSDGDDSGDDDSEQDDRKRLIAKRREFLETMELNAEIMTEKMVEIRLRRRLRRKEKAAERRRRAEMEEAAEAAAALAQKEGQNDKSSSSSDEKEPIPVPKFLPKEPVYAKPKLNILDWNSFRDLGNVIEGYSCVIDVLVGEPAIEEEIMRPYFRGHNWKARTRTAGKSQTQKLNPVLVSVPRGQDPLPERIRIHSSLVLKILKQFVDPDGATLDADAPSIVFLRPFKAFALYEPRLREWLKKLEEKNIDKSAVFYGPATKEGIITPTSGNDEIGDKRSDELESATAIEHVSCVLEFFSTYIAAKIDFVGSVNCRKVNFSDLWHLYRPGMEVIGSDGKQAYRVIQVTSAKHRPISMNESYYGYGFLSKRGEESEKAEFSLLCVYIDFDGKYIGPVLKTFDIKRFDGEREITSLEVYPLRYHKLRQSDFSEAEWNELQKYPDEDRCLRNLVKRGKKFVEAAGIKHMYYSGSTMIVREEVESQVVIDFETAFATEGEMQEHIKRPSLENFIGEITDKQEAEDSSSRIKCACCRLDTVFDDAYVDKNQRNDYISNLLTTNHASDPPPIVAIPRLFNELNGNLAKGYTLPESELAIMSYRVFGFVLRNRKWAQLDLTYLTDVRELGLPTPLLDGDSENTNSRRNENNRKTNTAFESLVLEKGHKEMIVSLITQHFRDREAKGASMEQVDIVRGKGKGLILLLHGAPGVGKTSTAEGVAERFKKPLFQITCGDLGVTARDVEKTLETNFNLATKWGCILLLDEADVFLAARDKLDFVRNGLVAAFLRVLEYYAGILFLTTNRIGDFDEAFTSRIHMSLYYPELDEGKTIEIFNLNLKLIQDRFGRMKRKILIDYNGIRNFAMVHFSYHKKSRWNGRQIRNACQTALALAEYQTQQMDGSNDVDPNITVSLTVDHFETVRDAYVEFTGYLRELYGTHHARRAQENALRVEDSNNGKPVAYTTKQIEKILLDSSKQNPEPQQFSRGRQERQNDTQILQHQPSGVQDSSFMHVANQSRLQMHARTQNIQNASHLRDISAHSQWTDQRQSENIQNLDYERSQSRDTSMTPEQSKGKSRTNQDNNSTSSSFREQTIPAVKSGDKKSRLFSLRKR